MARAVTLGNGKMLVGLDYLGQVRDLYYPYVGYANHVSGASGSYVHRIGVFVDGTMRWLDHPSWEINTTCSVGTGVGVVHAVNDELGVTLTSSDVVHNEENIFLRSFVVGNERNDSREIKVFFSQQFRIAESRRGDTGFYDPRVTAVIHYKGNVKFLINAMHNDKQFTEYSIGIFGIEGKDGTYHDAEDGVLERNPIEHGSVDSVIGVSVDLGPKSHEQIYYWIACGETIDEVHDLNAHVLKETPESLLRSTESYWEAWLKKDERDLALLPDSVSDLYERSLITIRTHTDNRGGIIASSDTDMLHHGRDTYSYVWPRDASIIANSLDRGGYSDVSRQYFKFMSSLIERGGYLMHKYRSDGALGSSWHPWMQNGVPELPIQEDETALTVCMLWQHYGYAKDIEFIESLYNPFIEPAANFMCEYIEPAYGLPSSSYDLWEEKYGISTHTSCAVYAALLSAAQFANLLGKDEAARTYSAVAQRMRQGILEYLYDDEMGAFVKLARLNDEEELEYDRTIDMSSFFGPVFFGVLEPDDERMQSMKKVVDEKLQIQTDSRGYVRYEADNYYKMQDANSPNPWIVTTLWMAQYYIMSAKTEKDLEPALEMLEWTTSHAVKCGILAEQMHPSTRMHLSTAPLIWSHAEFVITADEYIKKLKSLRDET